MTSVAIRPNIGALRPLVPGKPIEALRRELGDEIPIVKLASNENPLGPGPSAMAAAERELRRSGIYPDPGCTALRERLALAIGARSSQICVGNGSEDVLTAAAMVCAGPGSDVLLTDCGFPTYEVVASRVGARAVKAPMLSWGHDLAALSKAITDRTALIFVDNPRNPTGARLSRADFVAFMQRVPGSTLVVLDEAYFEYHRHDTDLDGVRLVERFDNLLVTRTFSKIHGLAGLRLGYGVAHEGLIDALNKVRMPFAANRVALAAAEGALADVAHVERSLAVTVAGKASLRLAFADLGLECLPSHGNFVTVLLPGAASPLCEGLLQVGIVVRCLASFGLPRGLRITAGTSEEVARFLEHFRGALKRATA